VVDTTMKNLGSHLLELNHEMGQCIFGSFTGTVASYKEAEASNRHA